MKLALTGFMGVGKTTLGKELAKKLNLLFIDLDEEITKGESKSIDDLLLNSESYFRKLEKAYLEKILKEHNNFILSLGGGSYCTNSAIKTLRNNKVKTIYLKRSEEFLKQQLRKIKDSRPLLNNKENWLDNALELYKNRIKFYEEADLIFDNDSFEINELLKIIEND